MHLWLRSAVPSGLWIPAATACTLAQKAEGYVLRLTPACSARRTVLSASAPRWTLAPGMLLQTMSEMTPPKRCCLIQVTPACQTRLKTLQAQNSTSRPNDSVTKPLNGANDSAWCSQAMSKQVNARTLKRKKSDAALHGRPICRAICSGKVKAKARDDLSQVPHLQVSQPVPLKLWASGKYFSAC